MIRAVIFDMDGLMLDTERLVIKAWDWAGEQLGVGPFGHLAQQTLGMTAEADRAMLRREFGDCVTLEQVNELKEVFFHRYFAERGVPVKNGLFDLLKWLKGEGIKTAVATSTYESVARPELELAGVLGYFNEVVCGNMVKHGKPAPDIFLLAAEKLGVSPENCMVLEDSPNGIRAAHAAGMYPVMVPDLVQPDEEIRSMTMRCVESLAYIPSVIEELNQ